MLNRFSRVATMVIKGALLRIPLDPSARHLALGAAVAVCWKGMLRAVRQRGAVLLEIVIITALLALTVVPAATSLMEVGQIRARVLSATAAARTSLAGELAARAPLPDLLLWQVAAPPEAAGLWAGSGGLVE